MSEYTTIFGSIADHSKGGVDVIDDSAKNYVFSNIYDVAARSRPWERVAVGKNFEYVVEVARAEGTSPWYSSAHDEFALCMDGEVEVHLIKLDDPHAAAPPGSEGAHLLPSDPTGRKMGRIVLRRGHMALLPGGAAYRFHTGRASALMIQTIKGPLTVEKWAEICQA